MIQIRFVVTLRVACLLAAASVIAAEPDRARFRGPNGSGLSSATGALDKRTGKQAWKVDRPEAKSGHSTPILWRGPDGRDQVLLPGSFLLTSYDAATGRKLWRVGGLSFEMKSTPVIGDLDVNGSLTKDEWAALRQDHAGPVGFRHKLTCPPERTRS